MRGIEAGQWDPRISSLPLSLAACSCPHSPCGQMRGPIRIVILTAVFYSQETEAQSGSQLVSEDGVAE